MDSLLDKVSTSLWQGAIYFEIFVAILIAGVYFESWYAVLIAFCILVFCFNIQKLKMLLFVLFSLFWCALPFITLQFDEGVPIGIILFSIFLFYFPWECTYIVSQVLLRIKKILNSQRQIDF